MILGIIVVLLAFVLLITLHELGHFILAKKFKVKVEEFGIGFPPRLIGKKIGETIYSINLLPLGGFVKIKGEDKENLDPDSFSQKPCWQRALIILGGVISFWLIAFLIFTLIAGIWGISKQINDDDLSQLAQVQITQIIRNSPAEKEGLRMVDEIIGVKVSQDYDYKKVNTVREVQEFIRAYLNQEINLKVKRKKEILEFQLVPHPLFSEKEGAIGIGLIRIVQVKTPWYQAPFKGLEATLKMTVQIPLLIFNTLKQTLEGKKVEGVEVIGPIGIGVFLNQAFESGLDKFLFFIGALSLWLALINLLPIPALDGGQLVFLGIEAIISRTNKTNLKNFQITQQRITIFFFLFLILLILLVTIKDIFKFFF